MKAPYSRLIRFLVPAILGLLFTLPLAAQTTVADPNDPLYADIDAWATKGLVKNLPRFRPYTMTMAIGLLKEVASGETADTEEASAISPSSATARSIPAPTSAPTRSFSSSGSSR